MTEFKENTRKKIVLIATGDKIMCTKNNDVPTYVYEEDSGDKAEKEDKTSPQWVKF